MRKLLCLFALAGLVAACDNTKDEEEPIAGGGVIDYIEFLRYDEGVEAGPHSKIVLTPTFDAKGRLVRSLEQYYFADHESGKLAPNQYYQTTFEYKSDNSVAYSRANGYWDYSAEPQGWNAPSESQNAVFPLNDDGYATEWPGAKATFEYTTGGYLEVYESNKGEDYWWQKSDYVWENGDLRKITKTTNRGSYDAYTFTYTTDENPFGNYDIFSSGLCGWIDGETGPWAAGVFGKHPKHLIRTETDENTTVTYSYKKDKNGRIVEVQRAEGGSLGGPVGGVFVIHWK
ncbi:MAG: DUF4595 domain-containing protein [Bacteroidales bacterium]|nr:DUF4595 domain-containing protein [Bacteroidales bacterium]